MPIMITWLLHEINVDTSLRKIHNKLAEWLMHVHNLSGKLQFVLLTWHEIWSEFQ